MKIPPLNLGRAYAMHAEELDSRLQEVARSGTYILGKNVAALEEAIADYLGTRHAVAVGSGTDALHLAVAGLGIGPGDEVITTPFTFAATVEAIEYVGAQPVLIDIDPAERDPSDYTGRTRWVYQELRDRKVAMFADRLPEGLWEIRYELRAETPGSFHALPVLGHAMYVPEIRCNGAEVRIEVTEAP